MFSKLKYVDINISKSIANLFYIFINKSTYISAPSSKVFHSISSVWGLQSLSSSHSLNSSCSSLSSSSLAWSPWIIWYMSQSFLASSLPKFLSCFLKLSLGYALLMLALDVPKDYCFKLLQSIRKCELGVNHNVRSHYWCAPWHSFKSVDHYISFSSPCLFDN